MSMILLDTMPQFFAWWQRAETFTAEEQIESWAAVYLGHWPEVLEKVSETYRSEGLDWREVARERVMPAMAARLPAMRSAYAHLPRLLPAAARRLEEQFDLKLDWQAVLYAGMENGAGWVTDYQGRPAILFGLEAIAECGWQEEATLEGLIAHELGHLTHNAWRDEPLSETEDAWLHLYSEGFAQYFEGQLLQRESWHETGGQGQPWLDWCKTNNARLAYEFLRDADAGDDMKRFFGSWYDIDGIKQAGYALGYEAVRRLAAAGLSLRQIAALDDPRGLMRQIVIGMSREKEQ